PGKGSLTAREAHRGALAKDQARSAARRNRRSGVRARFGTGLAFSGARDKRGSMLRKIALISEHASPLAAAGGVDSGGQNVYVAHVARQLARLGWCVDVFTRRDAPEVPDILEWVPGVRVVHVPAGPAAFVRKEDLLPLMG